jgi:hypothetical protein
MNGALFVSNPSVKDHADDRPLFKVRELDHDDGRPGKTIVFTGNVRPLGYAELAQAKLHEKLTIPLEMDGSTVVDTDIDGLDKSKSYNVRTTLESKFTSRAIGLVKGGWLPAALAETHPYTIILVDRNVVSQINTRFKGRQTVGAEPDFLDLFANRPVRINPLLFAMEGNAKCIPSPKLVREQLEEVVTKLRAALPLANLVLGPRSLEGALGLIEESGPGMARKQKFLVRIAPRLTDPISRTKMQARADEVIAVADECDVSRRSLMVLAALSSVLVPNSGSPAKGLLKFKTGYSEEDAYNALADLRSLELLIQMFTWFPGQPTLLCTCDRDLALFWAGIRASKFERNGGGIRFNLSPVEELIPGSKTTEWRACMGDEAKRG